MKQFKDYKKLRVFCGYVNTGGIAYKISDGLRKNGIKADSIVIEEHEFAFPSHKIAKFYLPSNLWFKAVNRFLKYIYFLFYSLKYNVFIFNTRSTLLARKWDLKFLRFLGKKTAMIYVGCDIRDKNYYQNHPRKYTACKNCSEKFQKKIVCVMQDKITETAYTQKNIDISFSHPFDAYMLKGNYHYLYLLLELELYKPNYNVNEKVKILHVPSDDGFKGTNFIIDALEKLKKENLKFEFELLRNKTHEQTIEAIKNCDILIDQMVAGWYGLISIEAMALGKTSVCYIDDKLYDFLPDLPIVNLNPENLAEGLKKIIENKQKLPECGKLGRAFVEKYHDQVKNSKKILDLTIGAISEDVVGEIKLTGEKN